VHHIRKTSPQKGGVFCYRVTKKRERMTGPQYE
jgi:hypothetical protein